MSHSALRRVARDTVIDLTEARLRRHVSPSPDDVSAEQPILGNPMLVASHPLFFVFPFWVIGHQRRRPVGADAS